MKITMEDFQTLLKPFKDQGANTLYASKASNRVLIGTKPATAIRDSDGKPKNYAFAVDPVSEAKALDWLNA
jgi:hypothetical protein